MNGSKEDLDEILKKYFTNSFRHGYYTVKGVTMPIRYQEMKREIDELCVNEEDIWICSFPKTGKFFYKKGIQF